MEKNFAIARIFLIHRNARQTTDKVQLTKDTCHIHGEKGNTTKKSY